MFEAWLPLKTPLERFIWLRHIVKGGGAAWVWKTITGSAPLTLANAVHHAIQSLTQYGLCTQASTPTPDAPVDIVCNNGALRYGPMGNNLFDPFEAIIKVGYYIAPADGAETIATTNFIYDFYTPVEAGQSYVFYGRRKTDDRLSQYNRIAWYDADKTYIGSNTYSQGTIGKGVAPDNAVYARLSCNPLGTNAPITIDTVNGYDWTFCKGSEEVIPFEPFVGGVKPVGTPEVLTVNGANLFDASSYTEINAYVNANTGVLTAGSPGSMTQYCVVIPCKPNAQYNITGRGTSAWGAFSSDSIGTAATEFNKGGILTTGPNDRYLIGLVRANGDALDYRNTLVVQEAQTVTDIPMLLSAGDYKDAAELINGLLTHKVGIKVFDGTETFTVSSSGAMITTIPDVAIGAQNVPLNTHFALETSPTSIAAGTQRFGASGTQIYSRNYYMKHTSITVVADFQAWLASEYAAGTPVILLYPLATETTEQTQAHALHTSEGTVIIDVTANVSPVELKVEYASTPSLGLGSPNQNEGE